MFAEPYWSKKSIAKTALSALTLSVILSLSACSGDKETAAIEPVVEDSVVDTPVTNSEVVDTEPVATTDTVTVEGEADPELTVLAADAGMQLYDAQCKVCHDNGLLNAPKYGDKVAWASALAKDKETLYSHSAQGFNKMPAQAINGVSEAQVKAAVDYMLAAVS